MLHMGKMKKYEKTRRERKKTTLNQAQTINGGRKELKHGQNEKQTHKKV